MRKAKAKRRHVLPDPKFHSELVSRFVNMMMESGQKNKAYYIFYDALAVVEEKSKQNGLELFEQALNNVMPVVEVRSRRVGGATFQVPSEVRPSRRLSLGIRWMIDYSRNRGEKTMKDRLANEILAAYKGEGAAVKKKEDVHKMAEANKAFSHFRF